MKKSRKQGIGFLLALMFVLLLAACGNQSEDTSAKEEEETVAEEEPVSEEEAWKEEPMYGKTITVTYGGGNCTGASYVALLLDLYKEEGLEVEVLRSGSTDAMNAVATGKAQVVQSHISQMTVPIVNGLELIMVGGAHTGCQSLYVLNDSEYETTADLVGKNVNISNGIGSYDHNIVLRFMARDGLSADDYNFKVTETSAVIQALQSGELDASLLSDPFAYKFVENGTLRAIRSLTWDEDFKDEPCCAIAMNKNFVEENPITAKKMLKVIAKASAWIDSNTEDSVQLMLENEMLSGDNIELLNYLQGSYDWTVTNVQCEQTMKDIISDYKDLGLLEESLDDEETLNNIWLPLLSDKELEEVWAEGAEVSMN